MSKVRYYFSLLLAYFKKFKLIILFSIVLGIVAFIIIRFVFTVFLSGKTERIGITGRYKIDELPNSILSQVSGGLTRPNLSNIAEPYIASSWETPDKGKTWVFHIKKNMKWHDHTEVTSYNISYQFTDVKIERPDKFTIVFKLDHPFSPFPLTVSKPIFKRGFIGVGEWKVSNISLKSDIVENLTITNGSDKRIYKFYVTEDRTKVAFKLGQVDQIQNIIA